MELTGARRLFRFRPNGKKVETLQPPDLLKTRVQSIDLLRGLVMVIMALDHVREYFHADAFLFDPTNLTRTNIPLFFTRFITHFCAPVFMLLSGTSAYLVGLRKGRKALSRFLITRGLWLVLLEFTIINFGWFFDISFRSMGTMVIWALGVSMMILAGLIYLPLQAILVFSLALIFGHNLLDGIRVPGQGFDAWLWSILHQPGVFRVGNLTWFALYPLIPWVAVMSLGYCLGSLYRPESDSSYRKRVLLQAGLLSLLAFVALRFTNWYGDPFHWQNQSSVSFTILSFLTLQKYPPSLLYLLVTLGPSLIFLALTGNSRDHVSSRLQVIGRVPLFFYLVHIYLIHLAAMVAVAVLPGHQWSNMILETLVTFDPKLRHYGFTLLETYLVWAGLVAILYFLCKWYDQYKRTRRHRWLSYL